MTHSRPLVTILINNYNYGRFLGQAIDSALQQTYRPIEVIVVDDGSTDKSRDIINSYGDRIRPILKANGGQASAFNAGIVASRGEIICLLDADDFFHPEKVEMVVRHCRPGSLLYHRLRITSSAGLIPQKAIPETNYYLYAQRYGFVPYMASPTSGLVISRDLAVKLIPLPTEHVRHSADDFVVRGAGLLGRVYGIPDVLATYRVHGENAWYGKAERKPREFISALQGYLNDALIQEGKAPVLDFYRSTSAIEYVPQTSAALIALGLTVIKRHPDAASFKFFCMTLLRAGRCSMSKRSSQTTRKTESAQTAQALSSRVYSAEKYQLQQPLVSIVINNYNYGRFVADAIQSALQQRYTKIEVVVVDDGSTDDSRLVIGRYAKDIVPVFKDNGGQASAFNTGFAKSSGEIVCLLDADDLFSPDKVKRIVQSYSDPSVGWCFHPLQYVDASVRPRSGPAYVQYATGRYDFRRQYLRGKPVFWTPPTSGLTFRRALLKKVLPMPEQLRITADNYLTFSVPGLAPGYYLSEYLSSQRIHGANAYTAKNDPAFKAGVQAAIASSLHHSLPELSPLANRLYANAIASQLNAGVPWQVCVRELRAHVQRCTTAESMEVVGRFLYRVLRQRPMRTGSRGTTNVRLAD